MQEIYHIIDGIKEELTTVSDMNRLSYRQGAIQALRDLVEVNLIEESQ